MAKRTPAKTLHGSVACIRPNVSFSRQLCALERMQQLRENGSPGYAVETIAPGDEITCDGSPSAIFFKRYY